VLNCTIPQSLAIQHDLFITNVNHKNQCKAETREDLPQLS